MKADLPRTWALLLWPVNTGKSSGCTVLEQNN